MIEAKRTVPTVMHANCGHGATRRVEDCIRLNFISAGQGDLKGQPPDFWGRQITNLIPGDILAVYRSEVGYIGIARVTSEPMDINNAILGGLPINQLAFSPESNMFRNQNNDYREWLVEVQWLTEVYTGLQQQAGFGMFRIALAVCSLDNQTHLRKELEHAFGIDFKQALIASTIRSEDEEITFIEGKERFLLHKSKERSSELVMLAKARHLENDARLGCQICSFSFIEAYGVVGEGYIEAHHVYPISELTEETQIQVEDLVMVCSNCHRMLHRKCPWLSVDEVKELLKQS